MEDFDLWSGELFNLPQFTIDAPSTLLAASEEQKRVIAVTRMSVRLASFMMNRLDTNRDGTVSKEELAMGFGSQAKAEAMLSFFDSDHDNYITLNELIEGILRVLHDRMELKKILEGRRSLGTIMGSIIGFIFALVCLVVILQIYLINVGELVLPLLTLVLPLAFIFGNSLKLMWESFLVVFVVQPWFPGELVDVGGFLFIVENINLLSTSGFTLEGLHARIPNVLGLSSNIYNYGRTGLARIRVYTRIKAQGKTSIQIFFFRFFFFFKKISKARKLEPLQHV